MKYRAIRVTDIATVLSIILSVIMIIIIIITIIVARSENPPPWLALAPMRATCGDKGRWSGTHTHTHQLTNTAHRDDEHRAKQSRQRKVGNGQRTSSLPTKNLQTFLDLRIPPHTINMMPE